MTLRFFLVALVAVCVPFVQAQKKTTQKQTTGKPGGTAQQVEATDRQRDFYQAGLESVGQVIQEAGGLMKMAESTAFNARDGRQQHLRLRKQVSALQANYGRFRASLNAEQKRRVQSHLLGIEADRGRMNTHLQEISREMARSSPDRTRITHHAREVRDSGNSWQVRYRNMSSPLRLK